MGSSPSAPAMKLKEYEEAAARTAIYPDRGNNITYPTLGLAGETGEVCEKIKKLIRDNNGEITDSFRENLRKELGDILWYIAAVAYEANISMDSIAKANIDKLASRKKRDKLKGSGDDR